MSPTLREQLIGAWELVEYSAHLPNDMNDKKYPMGPDAQGIIMYTPDGHMSAQLLTPGQSKFAMPGTESEWVEVGQKYVAYTGQFYLDEKGDEAGPVLLHQMKVANLPLLRGDTQRRLVSIQQKEDGTYLVLSLSHAMTLFGEDRMIVVRWKRLPDNQATNPPPIVKL